MVDKLSYKPPHSEDVATTLSVDELNALVARLMHAGGTNPDICNDTQVPPMLADTQQASFPVSIDPGPAQ